LQRSFVGCVSDLDQRVARAVGEHAVRYAMQGHVAGSVSVQRRADLSMEYPLIPLTTVAARTRTMDDAFIAPSGSDVTPAFLDYLAPLLGGALPVVQRLRAPSVPKVAGSA
jgi:hypothetical protein